MQQYNLIKLYSFSEQLIAHIEKSYKCRFICETSIKDASGGWYNSPIALFYNEVKHPEGSNWMALFASGDEFSVTNGISAVEPDNTLTGIVVGTDIIYSSYRHHFNCRNGMCIDGGRDYNKIVYRFDTDEAVKRVNLRITKDGLMVEGL